MAAVRGAVAGVGGIEIVDAHTPYEFEWEAVEAFALICARSEQDLLDGEFLVRSGNGWLQLAAGGGGRGLVFWSLPGSHGGGSV